MYDSVIDSKESDQELIHDPEEILKKYKKILISAKKEVLWIYHNINSISFKNKGIFEILSNLEKGIRIQVLIQVYKSDNKKIDRVNKSNQKIEFREIEIFPNHSAPISFLLVDKSIILITILKDKIVGSFSENVDLGILTNNQPIISSYYYIFNLLWYQTDLHVHIQRQKLQLERKNEELVDLFSDLRISFEALAKTNRKLELANLEIQRQKKKQIEFVNMSAHELRTPTQAISGYIEMIKISPQNLPKYLEALERNSNRLFILTEDLFSIAKIESGNLKLKKTKFDIIELAKEIIIDFVSKQKQKQNNNHFELLLYCDSEKNSHIICKNNDNQKEKEKKQLLINADRLRIFQVLSNLLNNSIKFTVNGSIIVKIIKKLNDQVEIRVKDTGKGIDPVILPKLFKKFISTSDYEGGSGMGLYIARKIIEEHGGNIWGINNPDGNGNGAEFGFIIPSTNKS